jgi:hypothetical protein
MSVVCRWMKLSKKQSPQQRRTTTSPTMMPKKLSMKWRTSYGDTRGRVPTTTTTSALARTTSAMSMALVCGMTQSSNLNWRMGAPNSGEGVGEGRMWIDGDPSGIDVGAGSLGVESGGAHRSSEGIEPDGEAGSD